MSGQNILFHYDPNPNRCASHLDLSLSVDEGFYGAVNSLVNQSRRPILMTTSHPAFCPVIAKLVKKPLHLFTFRFRAAQMCKLCPVSAFFSRIVNGFLDHFGRIVGATRSLRRFNLCSGSVTSWYGSGSGPLTNGSGSGTLFTTRVLDSHVSGPNEKSRPWSGH
jgi:hypothetical protein